MCKNTSQGIFMSYYLITYSIGLMILGMFSFVLVTGGRFSVTPLKYPDPDQQMFNCMSVGVACYTISYNLFCEITMFRCRAKYPILSTINMIATFAMIIALAMLFVYSNVNLMTLMGFCFIGASFGGLFLLVITIFRKDAAAAAAAAAAEEANDSLMSEEGNRTGGVVLHVGDTNGETL